MSRPPHDITLDVIGNKLSVESPHTILCTINRASRQITLARMELLLDTDADIPAGWRGKICMVSGIGRRESLLDSLPLGVIRAKERTPIGPYRADVPRDLLESKDDWLLEFFIIDLENNERLIFKGQIKQIDSADMDLESQLAELRAELDSKERALKEIQADLNEATRIRARDKKDYEQLLSALTETEEKYEKQLAEKDDEILKLNAESKDNIKLVREQYSDNERLRSENNRLTQMFDDLDARYASLEAELHNKIGQIAELQEKIGRLELERDRAERLTEEQKGKIEGLQRELTTNQEIYAKRHSAAEELASKVKGLQAELEANKEVLAQRSEQLEAERVRSQRLERELAQLQDSQTRSTTRLSHQDDMIERLSKARDKAEEEILALRNRLSEKEDEVLQLREQMAEVTTHLTQARQQTTDLQAQLDKALAGETISERYELIRRVEWGDAGTVYKVYDRQLNRAVALRVLPPTLVSDRRAFRQLTHEAQLLAKLTNINTIRLYDFVTEGEPYIALEYVDGKTFRKLLDTEGAMPLEAAADYMAQICKGLSYAHSQHIYHRNLRPEHLMLTEDGFVKIMDFGIAEMIRTSMARLSGKVPMEVLPYLSPEQLRGEYDLDGRSDIYSLGIVFHEMLTGRIPFKGETAEHLIGEQPVIMESAQIPPAVKRVIEKCLEKKPENRYATVEELSSSIAEAVRG
ncbi:MAG: hypothetical protein DWB42_13970 [Chloroflexi bacterium]|nr:hypothetical protein [Chloroflexota bacterium]MDL1885641.1 hypothetical protein [Anaerolineae bacterium CFX8]